LLARHDSVGVPAASVRHFIDGLRDQIDGLERSIL
jgi:hypothetical protein